MPDRPLLQDPQGLRRLLAFVEAGLLSRRQLLQLLAAGGAFAVIETNGVLRSTAEAAQLSEPWLPGELTLPPLPPGPGIGPRAPGDLFLPSSNADLVASVLRREDMLALRFEFYNLERAGNELKRKNQTRAAFIVVHLAYGGDFSPQNIAEEAFLETEPDVNNDAELDPDSNPGVASEALKPPGTLGASLAGPSRIAFRVPDDLDTIPYTMDALLNWDGLPLSVARHALPPPSIRSLISADVIDSLNLTNLDQVLADLELLSEIGVSPDASDQIAFQPGILGPAIIDRILQGPLQIGPGDGLDGSPPEIGPAPDPGAIVVGPIQAIALPPPIAEPTETQTAIEAPWRLIVSPNRFNGWAHARRPVTHNGRTELWHTRLGVRVSDAGAPSGFRVDETLSYYRTLRAIWTPGFSLGAEPAVQDLGPFRMSLSPNDRWQLVRLTSDFLIPDYVPAPVQADRFMLSALGAWMDVRGAWNDPDKSEILDIIEWRHRATMARDHYVRVVYEGFLYPFGHAATLVKVTERKFETVPSGKLAGSRAAYLRQRFFIVVRERERSFPQPGHPNAGRDMPFERVRLTTLITPILDDPNDTSRDIDNRGQRGFWPYVGGQHFRFHVVAEDCDGQSSEFSMPLAFISTTIARDVPFLTTANDTYASDASAAGKERRIVPLNGQEVALAPSSKADGVADGEPGDTNAEVKSLSFGGVLSGVDAIGRPRFLPV